MTASNAQRFLANEAGTDPRSLALQVYWGSLVEAYRDATALFDGSIPVIARQQIQGAKSKQFLMLSDTPEAEFHVPGQELLGQQFEVASGEITLDDILVAHHDVPIVDIMTAHFDVLAPLGAKDGRRLARDYEKRIMRLAGTTARAAAVTKNGLNIHNGGNRVTNSGSSSTAATAVATRYPFSNTGANNFLADTAQLAYLMDNDNVPEQGRYLFISPYIRNVFQNSASNNLLAANFNRDFNSAAGDFNNRVIGNISGFNIVVTTNLPGYTSAGHTGENVTTGLSKYQGQFNTASAGTATGVPVALALCGASDGSAAIGAVEAMGVAAKMVEDDRRNTMFLKSQLFVGFGQMHPWCAGAIEVTQ